MAGELGYCGFMRFYCKSKLVRDFKYIETDPDVLNLFHYFNVDMEVEIYLELIQPFKQMEVIMLIMGMKRK